MLHLGTTLVECKSGYGLDLDTEIKMLRVRIAQHLVYLWGDFSFSFFLSFSKAFTLFSFINTSRF